MNLSLLSPFTISTIQKLYLNSVCLFQVKGSCCDEALSLAGLRHLHHTRVPVRAGGAGDPRRGGRHWTHSRQ